MKRTFSLLFLLLVLGGLLGTGACTSQAPAPADGTALGTLQVGSNWADTSVKLVSTDANGCTFSIGTGNYAKSVGADIGGTLAFGNTDFTCQSSGADVTYQSRAQFTEQTVDLHTNEYWYPILGVYYYVQPLRHNSCVVQQYLASPNHHTFNKYTFIEIAVNASAPNPEGTRTFTCLQDTNGTLYVHATSNN